MNNKLIISDFYKDYILGFQFEDNSLCRIHDFSDENIIGNIYAGYVKDVVRNINAAFVEFSDNKKGFLSISELKEPIRQGDKILIQVAGDKIKNKDYNLTSCINLHSDCLILTLNKTDISISKKIRDKDTRQRLKDIILHYACEEYGFIIRTNATMFSDENICNQAEELIDKLKKIQLKFQHSTPKSLLVKKDVLVDFCHDFISKNAGEIVTDNNSIYQRLEAFNIDIRLHDENRISLSNKFALEKHLRNSTSTNVWLKSGAYLVIEPTEALTVIDVNTGKADCRTNRNETLKKINFEAALEISRQIRVRNLSGIIIVDFINMQDKDVYIQLENYMKEQVGDDFSPCFVVGFTKLGLMEISRKKKEKPLHEILG